MPAILFASAGSDAPLPPDLQELSPDKHSQLIQLGYRIFTATPVYARRFSGNALSCTNCHLGAGTRAHAAPMWAAWAMYPSYLVKADRVSTFEERVQNCFRFSLDGLPPPLDAEEIRALAAYSQWRAKGKPVGVELPGRGFPTLARTGSDPNRLRGKELYRQKCAVCHAGDGTGIRDRDGRWLGPPLWGWSSFNKGAGFQRIELLAGFIKANMPLDNANLSDQDAFDLAAWITSQWRKPDPRRGILSGVLPN